MGGALLALEYNRATGSAADLEILGVLFVMYPVAIVLVLGLVRLARSAVLALRRRRAPA